MCTLDEDFEVLFENDWFNFWGCCSIDKFLCFIVWFLDACSKFMFFLVLSAGCCFQWRKNLTLVWTIRGSYGWWCWHDFIGVFAVQREEFCFCFKLQWLSICFWFLRYDFVCWCLRLSEIALLTAFQVIYWFVGAPWTCALIIAFRCCALFHLTLSYTQIIGICFRVIVCTLISYAFSFLSFEWASLWFVHFHPRMLICFMSFYLFTVFSFAVDWSLVNIFRIGSLIFLLILRNADHQVLIVRFATRRTFGCEDIRDALFLTWHTFIAKL